MYVYTMLTLVMGASALWKGAIYPGIAGIIGPTLCWFAASGLKGSLLVGTSSQKIGGLLAATAFAAVGVGIVYHSGYWVGLFGYELTGVTWCLVGLLAGWISTTRQDAVKSSSAGPKTSPQNRIPQNHSASDEATLYGMLQVAETLRVAYARVVERKGISVMSEAELPASKEKIKAAILLCVLVRKLNGELDEKMYNAAQVCYGCLADFIADENRARRARKWEDYLRESGREINPDNLPWHVVLERYNQRIERGEIDARAEIQNQVDKMKEIGPLDELTSPSAEFARLCDEFKERLQSLQDPSRKPKELALLRQVLLPN